MKAKAKRIAKKLVIFIPVVIMLIVLIFFIHLFRTYDNDHFETVFEDSKYTVDMIAETIESFRKQGYEYNLDSDIYKTLILENTRFLNEKPGVNMRILDLGFNTIYEDEKIKEEYSISLFSTNSARYEEIIKAMKYNSKGELRVTNDDGQEIIIYWRQVPAPPDSQHYLVLSVDKEKVLTDNINTEIIIGLFIICIVLTLSLWDSVAMRLKK